MPLTILLLLSQTVEANVRQKKEGGIAKSKQPEASRKRRNATASVSVKKIKVFRNITITWASALFTLGLTLETIVRKQISWIEHLHVRVLRNYGVMKEGIGEEWRGKGFGEKENKNDRCPFSETTVWRTEEKGWRAKCGMGRDKMFGWGRCVKSPFQHLYQH